VLIWAIYDITDNNRRRKLARLLKDTGLHRVQKSVFLGNVEKNRLDELALRCGRLVDDGGDALYLFPACRTDFDLTLTLGRSFNRELVSDEILGLVI